jgi:uncharacterized protein (DUF433 family)
MLRHCVFNRNFVYLTKQYPMTDYRKVIVINPEVRFGKPCIRNTRISVYDVLSWLASGMTSKEILVDYPELTENDIQACLAYAADREHRTRVA